MVTTEHQKPVLVPVFDGLACLTNLDIVDNGLRYLVRATDDRHYRAIQTITIEHEGECVTFFHVHFSNRTDWAREHVRETITVAAEQPELPIILGDLNVLDIQGMADLYSPRYHTSYDVEPYISFPSKDEVLDYVLLPHGMTFTSVQCTEDVLSDHRPLLVEIDTAAATASLV
jgi:endonuclease/exonuclease/phosphatase family metal-dependent hydrolase